MIPDESEVSFNSGEITLEARYRSHPGSRGFVITHPHPLFGGSMFNPVVEKVCESLFKNGASTLRFNFRGTGSSSGHHDNGNGEQDDLDGAIRFFKEEGTGEVGIAGYSFGAWVVARYSQKVNFAGPIILISPPITILDFSDIRKLPSLRLVVLGSKDSFAPVRTVSRKVMDWNNSVKCEIIEGADHFYSHHLHMLARAISQTVTYM